MFAYNLIAAAGGEAPATPIPIPWADFIGASGVSDKLIPDPTQPSNFIGNFIGNLLPYILIFGGIALFIMLIIGGFTMLSNPTNPQAQEQGKHRITFALVGFLLLFVSYWIIQILQIIFNINILGSSIPTSDTTAPATINRCEGKVCPKNESCDLTTGLCRPNTDFID